MTFEEQFSVLQALDSFAAIRRDVNGQWYVALGAEVKEGGILSSVTGRGRTPQEAVEKAFASLTRLSSDKYVVVHASGKDRQAVRWNGFMWQTVIED